MVEFVEIPKEELEVNIKHIVNQETLDIDINYFLENDIILISSGTATGKTRVVGKVAKELTTKYDSNILSIVNLISLSREQITTFLEQSDTDLTDYQLGIKNFDKEDGVICINSLQKILALEDYDYKNKILYIDEVNDLIRALTHNDGLDKVLSMAYTTLIKLIKNCKKIIFSDATIDKNTINLLSARTENKKTILIKNEVKKFNNIKAIKYKDENMFIEKLRDSIKNKKYFLFGCDGCEKITEIYKNLLEEFPEQKNSFILFTSKEMNKITDAKTQFKDRYVFYSPSITTGVSFVLKDVKQSHYIYLTSRPLITPISLYQMSCRTRNLKDLHYYCGNIKPLEMKYKTIDEVQRTYKNLIKVNNRLLGLSVSRTEDDEFKVIDNTFFKLFCYNVYLDEIYATGFIQHYENRLIQDGFILSEVGETKRFEEQNHFKLIYEEIKEEHFDKFKQLYFNIETEEDLDTLKKEYKILNDRTELLNIGTPEEADQYKNLLTNEYQLRYYFNFLNLFKTSEYIRTKEKNRQTETFECKIVSTIYNKISLLEKFEKHYKINRFDFTFDNVDITKQIGEDFKQLYTSLFPKRTSKQFNTKQQLIQVYVNMIKNIGGDIPLITTGKKKQIEGVRTYTYSLNDTTIKTYLTLAKKANMSLSSYNLPFVEKLTGLKPDNKIIHLGDEDNEDDEDYKLNNYIHTLSYKQGVKVKLHK